MDNLPRLSQAVEILPDRHAPELTRYLWSPADYRGYGGNLRQSPRIKYRNRDKQVSFRIREKTGKYRAIESKIGFIPGLFHVYLNKNPDKFDKYQDYGLYE